MARKRSTRKDSSPPASVEMPPAVAPVVAEQEAPPIAPVMAREGEEVQPPVIAEPAQPRSRYEDVALDEQDDSIYLPPHINLEGMTRGALEATSMRILGKRPPDAMTQGQAVAFVRQELRAGLPGYGRGR